MIPAATVESLREALRQARERTGDATLALRPCTSQAPERLAIVAGFHCRQVLVDGPLLPPDALRALESLGPEHERIARARARAAARVAAELAPPADPLARRWHVLLHYGQAGLREILDRRITEARRRAALRPPFWSFGPRTPAQLRTTHPRTSP